MMAKVGDIVTIKGRVIDTGKGEAFVEFTGRRDAPFCLWLKTEHFISVETPPYRPKVGEYFTWGDGVTSYRCEWISEDHVLGFAPAYGPRLLPLNTLAHLRAAWEAKE